MRRGGAGLGEQGLDREKDGTGTGTGKGESKEGKN
jgi:hypothetical protein